MANSLQSKIGTSAFAFRGYNTTNLGRTPELLAHPAYSATMQRYLQRGAEICAEIVNRPVDLVEAVAQRREYGLDGYAEAVAMIVAADLAQVELLEEFHGVRFREAKMAYGYSLGELSAVACAGVFSMAEVLSVPVAMAEDSAALAGNVVMGILFSRGPAIDEMDVHRLCRLITSEGNGTIAVSSILTPNTYLLLGQNDTIASIQVADARVFARSGPHQDQPRTLATPPHADCAAATHSRSGRGNDGDDAWRIAAALPSRAVARYRRAKLRRLPCARYPARLD